MRVRIFMAGAIIAMLAAPGWAQEKRIQRYGEKDQEKSATERQAERDAERAYQRSLGNVPEKAAVDPWGSARSAETPKGDAKSAAKADLKPAPRKPKTLSTPN